MDNFYYVAILRGHTIEIISDPYTTETKAFKELESYNDPPDGGLIVVYLPANMEDNKLLS